VTGQISHTIEYLSGTGPATPTFTQYVVADSAGGESGWTDIAAVGTGVSGFAALAAAVAAFLALRRDPDKPQAKTAQGSS
jgi:hypothetical protein